MPRYEGFLGKDELCFVILSDAGEEFQPVVSW